MAPANARTLGGLRTKLFYGFGSVAYGVKDQGFSTLLMLYYNQVIGLPAQWVGAAILIALVFDALADPIVGQLSDNLRSRWGRRHPFMYAAAVPAAIAFWVLWNPPDWSQEGLFAFLVVMAIVVRTFITFYEIPSSALAAELTRDYDQRTSFMAFRYFFGWMGGLGMTILGFAVFFTPDAAHPVGQLNRAGYSAYAFCAAVVMVIAILVSALGTHRFIPTFSVPPKRKVSVAMMAGEVMETWSHRSFAALTGSTLFAYVATGVLLSLNVYFNTYFWNMSAQQIAGVTAGLVLAPFLALAIATPLSRRFGKKHSAIALFLGCLVLYCTPLTLGLAGILPRVPSTGMLAALLLFSLAATTMGISSSIMGSSMMTDVVEDSQLRTGRRSEGVFFSAISLVQKAVSGLGAFIVGNLLALVHFPQDATPQTLDPRVTHDLVLVYLPTIIVLFSLSILCLTFYRIRREDHEANLRQLDDGQVPPAPEAQAGLAQDTAGLRPNPAAASE